MQKLSKCGSCEKILDSSDIRYRCCDSDICSPECSFNRIQTILKIDPTLTNSHKWSEISQYKPIDQKYIPLLTISQDIELKNNSYLYEIYDYEYHNFSSTALCDVSEFYNKAKLYVINKLMDFI